MKEKSLFQLKRLWCLVSIVVVFSAATAVYIYLTSDLVYVPGYEGVNGIIDIYKVPLGILALLFPVVALVAASHRSEQTKKQIFLSESQNAFSNYYKHLEEFQKITLFLEDKYGLRYINHRELYSILFPQNSPNLVLNDSHGLGVRPQSKLLIMSEMLSDILRSIKDSFKNDTYTKGLVESFFSLLVGFSSELMFVPVKGPHSHVVSIKPFANNFYLSFQQEKPFLHYYIFAEYVSILESFCHVNTDFESCPNDPGLDKFVFQVLLELKNDAV